MIIKDMKVIEEVVEKGTVFNVWISDYDLTHRVDINYNNILYSLHYCNKELTKVERKDN